MADKRWEYRIERFADRTLTEDFLNEHGEQGWDLVSVRFDPAPADVAWLIFKREKAPDYAFLQGLKIEATVGAGDNGAQRPEGASPEGS